MIMWEIWHFFLDVEKKKKINMRFLKGTMDVSTNDEGHAKIFKTRMLILFWKSFES